MDFPTVLVVDFGAQYAQLIARRIREAGVYSEIVPSTAPVEEVLARKPAAIVLSGGPSSVYEPGAPQLDPALFEGGVPAFGICYGFQAMARALGGAVEQTGTREYGRTDLSVPTEGGALHQPAFEPGQGARVGRFLEEIGGALLQRLHDHRDVAVAGEEEHRRQVRLAGPRAPCQLLEQLEAAHAGNAHVDHQAVVAARRGAFQKIVTAKAERSDCLP